MKAIILAAGQGKRLMPLTADRPKCLVEVAGMTMLERQIRALYQAGVADVAIATGFRADAIDLLLDRLGGVLPNLHTEFNPFFAVSDNLATCWLMRHYMDGPFIVVNGDTLFEPAVAERVLAAPDDSAIRVTIDRKAAYDDDDMKVVLDGDRVRAIGKQMFERVDAESIGMLRFNETGAGQFREMLDAMMRSPDGKARWYLSAIDRLAHTGQVGFTDIHGLRWCEIDTPADLARAASRLGEGAAVRPLAQPDSEPRTA